MHIASIGTDGLWIIGTYMAVRRHAISGLQRGRATIFRSYIQLRALLLHSAWPLFSLSLSLFLFASLVRNPVSIKERFNPGESTRTGAQKGGLNFLLLTSPISPLFVSPQFIHIEALVYT